MKYLLIRHSKTDKLPTGSFGPEGAPLNEEGRKIAQGLHQILLDRGFNLELEPVATSEMLRAQQTAEAAGLKNLSSNALLNEVIPKTDISELIAQGKVPEEAIAAARAVLANPPEQHIWVTHGLIIAAILIELGIPPNPDKFFLDYCEIKEIDL
jgi:broad specificity phosphatase PhoE